jgi:PPOX class probable F420-dependent enzyme
LNADSNEGEYYMADFNSSIGRTVKRRLRQEQIIWLTTVDSHGTPQPRPVWFHWDGQTILIFSQATAAKVRHIARNPRVALNFNTDADGGDVGVLIGEAQILQDPLPLGRIKAYLRKYKEGIKSLGMTPESLQAAFRVAILVIPQTVRGS